MARGNKIVINENPVGRRSEGVIVGALLPGICVQVNTTEPDAGNRFFWSPFDKSGSGAPGLVTVLDYDFPQGKLATDAYQTGKRGFLYFPVPGDQLNMLIHDQSGTGATSDFSIGDPLMIEDATGKLLDALTGTGPYLARPFQLMETIVDLTADYLAYCIFTGY